MPRFSKHVLSQHLRTQCDRQLALSLYTNSERKQMPSWPEEDKTRGQIQQQLREEGNRWQATVLRNLEATFGAAKVVGTRDQNKPTGYDTTPLQQLLRNVQPDCFLVEGKYDVDAPAQTFRQKLGLGAIQDFNGTTLTFDAVVPDLIQVLNPADDTEETFRVLPNGDVQRLPSGDSRLQLRIIDIKLTSEPGAAYFAEVAYYAMTLAGWLQDQGLDNQFVVVPQAAVWPGSHQASHLRQQMHEWQQEGYSPTFADLIEAMAEDLEIVEFDVFAPLIRRLLKEKIPAVLNESDWTRHDWHVGSYCNNCDFLGFPWGQNQSNPPKPRTDLCWALAEQNKELSRIPHLSRGSAAILRDKNIPDVTTLAQEGVSGSSYQQAVRQHHELRARKTVVPSRAQALVNSKSFVAPASGTSASMPRWADLKIYLSTEFDLSSAISFSFGLKAFWYEPHLPNSGQSQRSSLDWGPHVYFVPTRSIQAEEQEFLNFLEEIRRILDQVKQKDNADLRSGRRTDRSTVQFYLWDDKQQEHFMRVVGRHLDAILADPQLQDLAWLFPSEEILPNPSASTRKSPITLVGEVVRNHVAAPVPHTYSLLRLVRHYHRQQDAKYVPTVMEYFQDPLSDLIPSERGHEIWVRRPPGPKFPGWIKRLQQFEETVKKKLRALEMVTSRLRDDLAPQLSYQAAPGISIGSPSQNGRPVPSASWDAQLWYSFARLDAEVSKLEAQQIRSMPPYEREARFKSARLSRRLTGASERQVLANINSRFGLQLQPAAGRYVYELRRDSYDVSLKPGDFTFSLSPESDAAFLDRRFFSFIAGTAPLEQKYGGDNWLRYQATMQDVLGASVEAIDREAGYIVISKINGRFPSMIDDLEAHNLVDLSQDVILDPTEPDFFTGKLYDALRAIGNPAIADDRPLVRRAVGLQGARNSPQSSHTPAADFLWNAPAMHATQVQREWKAVAHTLQDKDLNLNRSQWRALAEALTRRLAVIWGPPGTGKSRTLHRIVLAAALDAYNSEQSFRILVTAGTYTAIDNVLLKVHDDLPMLLPSEAYELHRVRSKFQPPEDSIVQRGIDLKLNKHSPAQAVRDLRQRLSMQQGITIVGMTPEQTHNFLQVGGTAQEEFFDLIVLDEASQMDTAHAILPICALASGGSLVLAGDDLQLAPIQKAEPPKELEDLVGSIYNFYTRHHSVRRFPLNVNYRSNSTLVNFGIRAGYNSALQAHSPDLRLHLLSPLPTAAAPPLNWPSHLHWTPEWSALLDPNQPVVCFVHDDTRSSQSNPFEAEAVAALLWLLRKRLSLTDKQHGLVNDLDEQSQPKPVADVPYNDDGFWERGVGIVTPHKAQVGRILSSLSRTFAGVDPTLLRGAVDTVDRFQGQQRDVIIGSFALGDPDAIRNEDEFLYSLNRFNVMASRARAKLVLFVSQTVVDHLSNDPETLRSSRLLKLYADQYCNHERRMRLPYHHNSGGRSTQLVWRDGKFKYHL